jgi:calcineurin-like phosphoesterase family protein
MDRWLAERWRARVEKHDEVYVLGDVSHGLRSQDYVRGYYAALPGTKHLILGNGDEGLDWNDMGFETVTEETILTLLDGTPVRLSHYPYGKDLRDPDRMILLHGHVHAPWRHKRSETDVLMIHVGWEAWRRMVSEQDIVDLIEEQV